VRVSQVSTFSKNILITSSAVDIIRIVKLIISIALNEAMKIFLLFYNMSLC